MSMAKEFVLVNVLHLITDPL